MTTCGSKFNSTCGIVDGFVTTGSTEKGKSVGRPPVNEEMKKVNYVKFWHFLNY
jgi:hypothetical protein